jgi:hypothetical protein
MLCSYEDDRLWMYHGDEQLQNENGDNMLFENIIAQVYDFLRAEKARPISRMYQLANVLP